MALAFFLILVMEHTYDGSLVCNSICGWLGQTCVCLNEYNVGTMIHTCSQFIDGAFQTRSILIKIHNSSDLGFSLNFLLSSTHKFLECGILLDWKGQKRLQYKKMKKRTHVAATLAFVLPYSSPNGIPLTSVHVCTSHPWVSG